MSTEIIDDLAPEVGAWADKNFDFHGPIFGMAEEAGELLHALLKMAQNIRGTTSEHEAAIVDALADISIYAAHASHMLEMGEPHGEVPSLSTRLLGTLFVQIGYALQQPDRADMQLPYIMDTVYEIANQLKIPLKQATLDTWAEVRKRDWRQFPKNGLTA